MLGPLAAAACTGSLSIPHNDAWAFSKAAQTFAHTGHVRLLNWNSMSLVGLFVPLGPLGASITAQQCYVAALALLGIAASLDVLRPVIGSRRAALAVLVLVSWPGFGLLSTSMMTDVPAYTALAASLALGRRALDRRGVRDGRPWLTGALWALWLLVSLWGFTIREQTIAAPLAVIGAGLTRRGWRDRGLVSSAVVLFAAAAVFERWRKHLPGGSSPSGQIHYPGTERVLTMGAGGWLMLGLVLSPLLILGARPWRWSWTARITALPALGALLLAVSDYGVNLPEDYLERQGSYPSAFLGVKPDLFPQPLWDALIAIAVVGGALLAGMIADRIRVLRRDLRIVLVLTLAGTVLELVAGQILFDRYLLPLVLPLAALLLHEPIGPVRGPARAHLGLSAAAWLLIASLTGLATLNALTYDAATWHAAADLVAAGRAEPGYVNAGFAWTAYQFFGDRGRRCRPAGRARHLQADAAVLRRPAVLRAGRLTAAVP